MKQIMLCMVICFVGCTLPPTDEQACENADGEWICEGRYCRCEVYDPSERNDEQ